MANHLNEMENEGLIVIGRPVNSEFESTDAIKEAAKVVSELATKHDIPLGFVYAGSTINWPHDFEFTPSIIGLVTHVDYGSDEADGNEPLPRSALTASPIPDKVWEALSDHGLDLADETATYLAVAGWAWTEINADGRRIKGVSAEDHGFIRIDDHELIMEGDEPLTMRTSYC